MSVQKHRMSLRSKLSTAIDNPHIVWTRLLQKYFQARGHDGIDIMDRDWDNLLILDACRYDLFDEVFPHNGNLDSIVSRGSDTPEFLESNFVGRSFHDTVYVSANPQTERISKPRSSIPTSASSSTSYNRTIRFSGKLDRDSPIEPSEVAESSKTTAGTSQSGDGSKPEKSTRRPSGRRTARTSK